MFFRERKRNHLREEIVFVVNSFLSKNNLTFLPLCSDVEADNEMFSGLFGLCSYPLLGTTCIYCVRPSDLLKETSVSLSPLETGDSTLFTLHLMCL